jgi:CDP-diacylglycerol---serine O-phosphatidyltransferase
MDDAGFRTPPTWLAWMFALTLYAGLTMVTNVPFYSFKDLSLAQRAVCRLVAGGAGHCVINIHPPIVLFGCSACTACRAMRSTAGARPRASPPA